MFRKTQPKICIWEFEFWNVALKSSLSSQKMLTDISCVTLKSELFLLNFQTLNSKKKKRVCRSVETTLRVMRFCLYSFLQFILVIFYFLTLQYVFLNWVIFAIQCKVNFQNMKRKYLNKIIINSLSELNNLLKYANENINLFCS